MHDLSVISIIKSIKPIEGKDRIVLANVENYNVIINKEDFKEGDKCIYIFYDSFLPVKPEFEFLRKRCFVDRFGGGFRIKSMKMGGVISEGLVLPLSILPKEYQNAKVGTVLDDIIGVRNYEELLEEATPPSVKRKPKWWMKYKILRRLFGAGVKKEFAYPCTKSDEENIEKIWDKVKDSKELFYRSIKLEGQAFTGIYKKRKLLVFSHNNYVESGNWKDVAVKYNMKNTLPLVNKYFKTEVAIQGEICGPGIQKNIYQFKDLQFFLYGAYDSKTGRRMNIDELHEITKIMNIPEVAYLESKHILGSIDEMLEDCNIKPNNNLYPYEEGVVWRTYDGSIHFKCKSRPYKVWFAS